MEKRKKLYILVALIILLFLLKQGILHFHFVLSSPNYVVGPSYGVRSPQGQEIVPIQ